MLTGYSGHVVYCAFAMYVVSSQYPPLNDVSCVYWYRVGCYSPQTPHLKHQLSNLFTVANSHYQPS